MKKIGPFHFPDQDTHFDIFDKKGGIENYQRPQRDYALTFIKEFRVAADVGAHVGIFSSHFAKVFDEVIAFEPSPILRECLELNVPQNVRIMPVAVSDHTGEAVLVAPGLGNSGQSYLLGESGMPEDTKTTHEHKVCVVTIDSLELPILDLIKIDVQGADAAVVRGGLETFKRCKTVVLIEEKPIGGPTGSTEHIEEIQKLLLGAGATMRNKVGADRTYTF